MKDIQSLLQIALSDDRIFFGIVAAGVVLIVLLVVLMLRMSAKKRAEETYDEAEEEDKTKSQSGKIVESVMEAGGGQSEAAYDDDAVSADTMRVYRQIGEDGRQVVERVEPITDKMETLKPEAEEAPIERVKPPVEEAEKPEEKPEQKPKEAPKTLAEGLQKTKGMGFMKKLNSLFGRKRIDDDLMEELEEALYAADIGKTATSLFDEIVENAQKKELSDPDKLRQLIKDKIYEILQKAEKPYQPSGNKPEVILMVGVNGVGKTTTIGKLAKKWGDEGRSVMLASGDTFRAAAVEQLAIWGDRACAEVITAKEGANPSGVVYNAVQAAIAREKDVLIADTAGRLHTKYNLMEELKKIRHVASKAMEGRDVDEIWLVIDANTGQNAVAQAEKFHEALGLTGLILTKLDGTAKGGVVIGITHQLGVPIRYIGIGEKVEDLRPFNAKEFVDALF